MLEEQIENIGEALPKPYLFEKPTLFIKGELSNYILDEDLDEIHELFTHVGIASIAKASHWVHAENPAGFLQALTLFLEE